ncbi:MAG: nicotinate-nucleotide--dimethylbenzimidazole phosphoribosyltransferase [Pseudonocardiales bacterium]|nr:nicotinate-nucleotide--dimethylbenzimidazole phosphoribosyltransferase [Pseudonocardiales bacterium]
MSDSIDPAGPPPSRPEVAGPTPSRPEVAGPTPSRLEVAVDGIDFPDSEAAQAAQLRQDELTKPRGSLGRLEELSVWAASVQGQCPPRDFGRVRVVVFAGDHGVVAAGVSARPVEVTAQLVRHLFTGAGAVNVLAELAGATVRLADLAVAEDTDPVISELKVRRSSGRIDREDALTAQETRSAIEAGMTLADAEIDAGADLLVLGHLGVAASTPASALISVLTDTEPVKVIGRGSGIDDASWINKCAVVRDARRRGWPHRFDISDLLAAVGGADIAAMTGFLLQAAYRKTPVLLDDLVTAAAALTAQRASARVVRWIRAGQVSHEPAEIIALERLGLEPILALDMSLGEGTGALVALPVLRAAIRTLGGMSTRDEAGISD